MNKKDQKHFQSILERRKQEILNQAEITKEKGMAFDPDDLPDEVDLASSEADQSMNLRLRDRERVLLKKVDKALKKIEDEEYGVCESCGEEIGVKRLLELLLDLSCEQGEFTLSSGRKSNFYFDGKQTALNPEGAYLLGHLLFEKIREINLSVEADRKS